VPTSSAVELDAAATTGRKPLLEDEVVITGVGAGWPASDAASFVTGAVFPVDGGYAAR
jgi:hypothetical protein